ncbi:MAG: hypothetical protein IPI67_34490 [Myxococcales bacterium]|nr:hypothetical protein [Myxococcales bacterium]
MRSSKSLFLLACSGVVGLVVCTNRDFTPIQAEAPATIRDGPPPRQRAAGPSGKAGNGSIDLATLAEAPRQKLIGQAAMVVSPKVDGPDPTGVAPGFSAGGAGTDEQ